MTITATELRPLPTELRPLPATPPWLVCTIADPHTRRQLSEALHQAVHERRGPLLELVDQVLADAGLCLERSDTIDAAAGGRDVPQTPAVAGLSGARP
jgi:hypothetical protein